MRLPLLASLLLPAAAGPADSPQEPLPAWVCGTRFPATAGRGKHTPFPNHPLQFWPGGRIPYRFDGAISTVRRQLMRDAMDEWEQGTGVRFVLRDQERAYVTITTNEQPNLGTYSGVGYYDQENFIRIGEDAWDHGLLLHELGHALGFWHTQARRDRNDYVVIETTNIQAGAENQFAVQTNSLHFGPYDFASIMHYRACAFSLCSPCASRNPECRTITVRPPFAAEWQSLIGRRSRLSEWDKLTMQLIYAPADTWRFADQVVGDDSRAGTFLDPYRSFVRAESQIPVGGTVVLQQAPTPPGVRRSPSRSRSAPLLAG